MWNKNTETFLDCGSDYQEADIVLFGAPFDSTTSYRPGARFGSRAIRNESYGLENYSPYQDRELGEFRIFDGGDLELGFGNAVRTLREIEERTGAILDDGKLPFMLGGEHLVTLGAVRACAARVPELVILHFDAHADLREEYLGEKLSHACVLRRCHDLLGDGRIYQFGIRSGDREEFRFAAEHVHMRRFDLDGAEEAVEQLKGRPVYLTVDLDVLDPCVFPGTGTPEPGGVSFEELRRTVTYICRNAAVTGCDVNELSPHYDQSGASTAAACKIVREMLIALGAGKELKWEKH